MVYITTFCLAPYGVKRNHSSNTRHCPSVIVQPQKSCACEDTHKRSSDVTVQTQIRTRLSETYQGHYTVIWWIGKCMEGNGRGFVWNTKPALTSRETRESQENFQSGPPVSGNRTESRICKTWNRNSKKSTSPCRWHPACFAAGLFQTGVARSGRGLL
jgi:hypothetical protein